ncbi:MAG TPA: hypothetical protein VM490_25120, partial [Armatimonadaceae bacterium]|nr:hypothetical protein [Armatimonadaceae bacterium]
MRNRPIVAFGLLLGIIPLLASAPAARSQGVPLGGGWTAGGSVRARQEVWDWFEAPGFDNAYTFNGTILRLSASGPLGARPRADAGFELAAPLLLGLPDDAFAPPPQGALGLGALYRGNNGSRQGSLFLKQGWVRVRDVGARGASLRAGRFEFGEGRERTPPDPSLAWVKSQRVAERLIGPFAWTHVGRSFDGIEYTRPRTRDNLTAVLAYPTRGVFDLNGWPTLTDVRFGYLGYTLGSVAEERGRPYEWRVFGVLYE